jgi:hypothetical protein
MACKIGTLQLYALLIATAVSGCGLYTPDKDPFVSNTPDAETQLTSQSIFETAIVNHVQCEIAQGLKAAEVMNLSWLRDWGTTVTQTITVEDQTGLSPGISTISPLQNKIFTFPAASGGNVTVAQSFSFNLGGTASASRSYLRQLEKGVFYASRA